MRSLVYVLVLTIAAAPLAAQGPGPAPVALGKPLQAPSAEFTRVSWAWELRPGHLLVADAVDQRLTLLDLATGKTSDFRKGSGPGEFRSVGDYPLSRSDSGVTVSDFIQRRFLPISPSGAAQETTPFPALRGSLRAVDAMGRIYGEIMRWSADRRLSDSVSVVRFAPGSNRVDTLFTTFAGRSAMISAPGEPARVWYATMTWAVLGDGTVLVIDNAPYRVRTWKDGRWSAPIALPWDDRPPTAAEKQLKWDEMNAEPVRSMGGGQPSAPIKHARPNFPAKLPAFEAFETMHLAPDGTVWIARLAPGRAERLYDVVGPGGLRGRVSLPARATVVGFGTGGVYAAQADDDDVVRVRRYAMPTWK